MKEKTQQNSCGTDKGGSCDTLEKSGLTHLVHNQEIVGSNPMGASIRFHPSEIPQVCRTPEDFIKALDEFDKEHPLELIWIEDLAGTWEKRRGLEWKKIL